MITWGKDYVKNEYKYKNKTKKIERGKTKKFSKRRSSEYLEKQKNLFDISIPNDLDIKHNTRHYYHGDIDYIHGFENIAVFLILYEDHKELRDAIARDKNLMMYLKDDDLSTVSSIDWCDHIGIVLDSNIIDKLYKNLNKTYKKLPYHLKQLYKWIKHDISNKTVNVKSSLFTLGFTKHCYPCKDFNSDLFKYTGSRRHHIDVFNTLVCKMSKQQIYDGLRECIEQPWFYLDDYDINNLIYNLEKVDISVNLHGIYVTPDNIDIVTGLIDQCKIDIDETLHKNVNILLGYTYNTRGGLHTEKSSDRASIRIILKAIDSGGDVHKPFKTSGEYCDNCNHLASLEHITHVILSTKTKEMETMRIYFNVIYKMIRYKTCDLFSRKRIKGVVYGDNQDYFLSKVIDLQPHLFGKVMSYYV